MDRILGSLNSKMLIVILVAVLIFKFTPLFKKKKMENDHQQPKVQPIPHQILQQFPDQLKDQITDKLTKQNKQDKLTKQDKQDKLKIKTNPLININKMNIKSDKKIKNYYFQKSICDSNISCSQCPKYNRIHTAARNKLIFNHPHSTIPYKLGTLSGATNSAHSSRIVAAPFYY